MRHTQSTHMTETCTEQAKIPQKEASAKAKKVQKKADQTQMGSESQDHSDPKTDSTGTPTTEEKKKKIPRSQRTKRGPARPLRRVSREVLDSRIEKLDKRLKRVTAQMEDASRHHAAYVRELQFRIAEGETKSKDQDSDKKAPSEA